MTLIREVSISDVPGKLGGKTAVFMLLPEYKELRDLIMAGIAPGRALELELSQESQDLVSTRRPMEGFKRALLKLLPQTTHAYDVALRGSTMFVIGVDEPKHKNGVPAKKARKKK